MNVSENTDTRSLPMTSYLTVGSQYVKMYIKKKKKDYCMYAFKTNNSKSEDLLEYFKIA